MPVLRLRRRRPPGEDVVIDLTGTAPDTDAVEQPVDPQPEVDSPAADQPREDQPPADQPPLDLPPLDLRAEDLANADGSRVGRLLGLLTLSRHYPVDLAPITCVFASVAWALATVLIGCLAATVGVGLVVHGGVVAPGVFIALWRAAHLMPVATADGSLSLLPMVPAGIVWLVQLRACFWLEARLQGRSRPSPAAGLAAFVGGYFVVAALIATSPASVSQAGPLTQGWGVLLLMPCIAACVVWVLRVVRPAHRRIWLMLRACLTALAAILTASFMVLMLQLLLHWTQFQDMTRQLLDSGSEPATRIDAAALGAIQLAYLPNAAVWVASYLLGAGFVVGQGTIVSPFSVTTGTLPDLPLVVLLPSSPLSWPWLPPLLLALLSIVAGVVIRSSGLTRRLRTRVVVALGIALAGAVAMTVLAALSSGGLGPGRLDHVGPRPLVTFVAAFGVFGFGQLLWALFPTVVDDLGPFIGPLRSRAAQLRRPRLRRLARLRPRRPGGTDDGPDSA